MKTFDIDETFTAKAADGYTKITFTVIGRDELKRAKELSFKGGNFSTALNLATDHTQAVSAYGEAKQLYSRTAAEQMTTSACLLTKNHF